MALLSSSPHAPRSLTRQTQLRAQLARPAQQQRFEHLGPRSGWRFEFKPAVLRRQRQQQQQRQQRAVDGGPPRERLAFERSDGAGGSGRRVERQVSGAACGEEIWGEGGEWEEEEGHTHAHIHARTHRYTHILCYISCAQAKLERRSDENHLRGAAELEQPGGAGDAAAAGGRGDSSEEGRRVEEGGGCRVIL